MRLTNISEKIKAFPDLPKDIFVLLVIFLVGAGAYALGREGALSEKRGAELRIVSSAEKSTVGATDDARALSAPSPQAEVEVASPQGMYVGSRGGTTYHLPWCAGAKRIKEENKVWFASKEEAVGKGYKPATNCKGI